QVERTANSRREQHLERSPIAKCLLIGPSGVPLAKGHVELLAQATTLGESHGVQPRRRPERLLVELLFVGFLDLCRKVGVSRLAASAERIVRTAEPAAGEFVGRRRTRASSSRYR